MKNISTGVNHLLVKLLKVIKYNYKIKHHYFTIIKKRTPSLIGADALKCNYVDI